MITRSRVQLRLTHLHQVPAALSKHQSEIERPRLGPGKGVGIQQIDARGLKPEFAGPRHIAERELGIRCQDLSASVVPAQLVARPRRVVPAIRGLELNESRAGVREVAFARSFKKESAFATAIGLSLLFNLALHCLYGVGEKNKIEFFEYSGNFTFLVLIVVSSRWFQAERRPSVGPLVVLAVLMAVNGAWLLRELLELYQL